MVIRIVKKKKTLADFKRLQLYSTPKQTKFGLSQTQTYIFFFYFKLGLNILFISGLGLHISFLPWAGLGPKMSGQCWPLTHMTFSYLALQQKKILLSALYLYLNVIVHVLQLNEWSAFVFIVHNFLPQFLYFVRVWLLSINFYQ